MDAGKTYRFRYTNNQGEHEFRSGIFIKMLNPIIALIKDSRDYKMKTFAVARMQDIQPAKTITRPDGKRVAGR